MADTYDEETKKQLEDRKRIAKLRRTEQIRRRNNYLLLVCGVIVVLIFIIVIFKSCSSEKKDSAKTVATTQEVTIEETTTWEEKTTAAKVLKKTTDKVNFRKRKKITDNNIIETLQKGTVVEVIDESDDTWVQIVYDGKTGYVSKDYLK